MQNALDQFENVVFNVRPRYAVVASDFREPLRQASEIIAGARTEAAAELENVKGFAVEAKEVLGTVREAAKREGVQNFAPLFEDLAEENGKESITWLWWAAGLGAAHHDCRVRPSHILPGDWIRQRWDHTVEPACAHRDHLDHVLRDDLDGAELPRAAAPAISNLLGRAPRCRLHDLDHTALRHVVVFA